MTMLPLPYSVEDAVVHLSQADERMAALIHAVGPHHSELKASGHPFEALSESIVYQQLSGKAAGTIWGRFRALLGHNGPLNPAKVLELDPDVMRGAGLSRAKTRAIRDLAEKTVDGLIPDRHELQEWEDEIIIERLTSVQGIGPWTVKMYLMSRLGRPDVLPHTDLGIRKGVQRMDGMSELPAPKEVIERAAPWRPYRTLASWYLWRCLDLEDDSIPPFSSLISPRSAR